VAPRPYANTDPSLVVVEDPSASTEVEPEYPPGMAVAKENSREAYSGTVLSVPPTAGRVSLNRRLNEEVAPILDQLLERQLAAETMQNFAIQTMVAQVKMLEGQLSEFAKGRVSHRWIGNLLGQSTSPTSARDPAQSE